jgi:hypothetical protein
MNISFFYKNKDKDGIDEYIDKINEKCEKKMPIIKNTIKIKDDNIIIPTITNYNDIVKYNYNVNQLKSIAKNYKLKIGGNKNQLLSRIFSYLYLSSYIINIQKVFRGMLVKKFNKLHGPACINRKLCTNTNDFITMEPLNEISFYNFISYKDTDNFIYGFDIISLHNLFLKSKENENNIRNPYNRNLIPQDISKTIKTIIRLSRILNISISLHYDDDIKNISVEKAIELRALSLFQNIDSLGNYSNSQWFLSLNRIQLTRFSKELIDIWNYRAQLTNETKRNICPPYGNPFRTLSIQYVNTEPNISNVKKIILDALENLVNCGINNDSKALGAYYVLGALTLVNSEAATSLPWLFHSFGHF